ncbi:MAG TPA: YdbL family protein [Xanthomonadaceae bacterium]|nr:YdbL family protein [Xanthomonadaceae bacterium]
MRKLLDHRKLLGGSLVTALLLTACVTINVYFPAAQAQEAAKEFVDKVIGPDDQAAPTPPPASTKDDQGGGKNSVGIILLSLVIPAAEAQSAPDITIRTPAIQAIQARMAQRFTTALQPSFDSGALGFTRDGLIRVRDATRIALKDRVAVNQSVADDNRDRQAVYREIAVANGHAEWESQIRETFAKQWIASAHKGWWYQDASGAWKQK